MTVYFLDEFKKEVTLGYKLHAKTLCYSFLRGMSEWLLRMTLYVRTRSTWHRLHILSTYSTDSLCREKCSVLL